VTTDHRLPITDYRLPITDHSPMGGNKMKTTLQKTAIAAAAFGSLLLSASTLLAQAPAGTVAIEQDWRVELYSVPESGRLTCPLFISSFSIPGVEALFQCTWNHRDIPILEEGGIQLQAYKWDYLLDDREVVTPPWREKLTNANEVVTWTQRVRRTDLQYIFKIKDIVGTTWGSIPGPYQVERTFLYWAPPLEAYTFQEIADKSGIVMGSNRFKRLAIVRTRFYDYWGNLISTDAAEHVLFSQPSSYKYFEMRQLDE